MAKAGIHPDSATIWERVWSSPLGREITIALAVKFVVLVVVWWMFFSDPIDEGLDHIAVERVLINLPAAAPPAQIQPRSRGPGDG